MKPKIIGVKEGAAILSKRYGHSISARRVNALILEGRIPATKVGRDWAMLESDLTNVEIKPRGRPSSK
ncbi:MAG: hypothetical protein ACE5IR_28330 [bacterium]